MVQNPSSLLILKHTNDYGHHHHRNTGKPEDFLLHIASKHNTWGLANPLLPPALARHTARLPGRGCETSVEVPVFADASPAPTTRAATQSRTTNTSLTAHELNPRPFRNYFLESNFKKRWYLYTFVSCTSVLIIIQPYSLHFIIVFISYEGAVLHAKLGEEFQIMQTNKQQGKIYTVP